MSSASHTRNRPNDRSARNPWSTEPELPPDGYAEHGFDARAALIALAEEVAAVMKELVIEVDTLRPMLAVDPSSHGDYTAAVRRLAAAEQTAVEVHAARTRLNEGTYGFCMACAGPIPSARLELRPQSRVCVACS